jgi:hypothetical protein
MSSSCTYGPYVIGAEAVIFGDQGRTSADRNLDLSHCCILSGNLGFVILDL